MQNNIRLSFSERLEMLYSAKNINTKKRSWSADVAKEMFKLGIIKYPDGVSPTDEKDHLIRKQKRDPIAGQLRDHLLHKELPDNFTVKWIKRYCKYFGCSSAFLLSEIDTPTQTHQDIMDATGLSLKAASMLLEMSKHDRKKVGIDFLNATAEMKGRASVSYILMLLYQYCYESENIPDIIPFTDNNGNGRTLAGGTLYREGLKTDIMYALDAVKFPKFR